MKLQYRITPPIDARRGSLLLEGIAGLVALGIALVLINKATIAIDRQWRLSAQERLAVETLDNALEMASALDWPEVTAEGLADLPIPERVQESLYRASLDVNVEENTEPVVVVKRIQLTLTWQPTPDATPLRRTLTGWVHGPEEGS